MAEGGASSLGSDFDGQLRRNMTEGLYYNIIHKAQDLCLGIFFARTKSSLLPKMTLFCICYLFFITYHPTIVFYVIANDIQIESDILSISATYANVS